MCFIYVYNMIYTNTNIKLNFTKKFSSYRAVNTPCLSYKNQSVKAVYGNNRSLFCDPDKTHKYSVCGQNVELLCVKPGGA